MIELFLFGHLFLVVGDPNILICFPLLGDIMEQGTLSFLICSIDDSNNLYMSLTGHMGSHNLCKLHRC
jgi:hypothetical protein